MTGRDLRFLLVDQRSTMRRILRDLLTEIGYTRAEEAQSAKEAWQKLQGQGFGFVISDITMAHSDAFGFLSKMQSAKEFEHIPVLVVSAQARRADIILAIQSGAAGFIVKPFTRTTLQRKIGLALSHTERANAKKHAASRAPGDRTDGHPGLDEDSSSA